MTPLRILFLLVAAAFEATLFHLGVAVVSLVVLPVPALINWLVLWLVCLLGAWATLRLQTDDDYQPTINRPLVAACVFTIMLAAKTLAGGGWNPVMGWSALWPFGAETNLISTLGWLLVGLWCWWRGMHLIDHDHRTLLGVLQTGALALVVLLLLTAPLAGAALATPPFSTVLATEAVALVSLGLISLALARITDQAQPPAPGTAAHWLRSSMLTAAGIVVTGTLVIALVSDSATDIIQGLLIAFGALVGLLVTPLNLLAQLFITRPSSSQPQPSPSASAFADASSAPQPGSDAALALVSALFNVAVVLLVLVPIIIIALLILASQRRRHRRAANAGETHESLWNWRKLGADLAGMLKQLRPARPPSLRDVLARLRSDRPAERIRRRYVQLLLLGEAAQRERPPAHTPLEFAPTLAPLAPAAPADVQMLTELYDRARYAPATVQPADAERADHVWNSIQSQAEEPR